MNHGRQNPDSATRVHRLWRTHPYLWAVSASLEGSVGLGSAHGAAELRGIVSCGRPDGRIARAVCRCAPVGCRPVTLLAEELAMQIMKRTRLLVAALGIFGASTVQAQGGIGLGYTDISGVVGLGGIGEASRSRWTVREDHQRCPTSVTVCSADGWGGLVLVSVELQLDVHRLVWRGTTTSRWKTRSSIHSSGWDSATTS